MKTENKSNDEILMMAFRSRLELKARQGATHRAHGDRIRQLESLMQRLASTPEGEGLPGIQGAGISPELTKLLVNPTGGL